MNISAGFNEVATNPYFIVVASLASIFGTIIAFSIFFPAQKRPFYAVKSFNLIQDSSSTIDNLEVKYNSHNADGNAVSEDIKSLTASRIIFWNGGRKTIKYNDIATVKPITISIEDSQGRKILKSNLITKSVSNNANNFNLDSETNVIKFDFLEMGDGAVFEVLHTGLSSEEIILDGYIQESKFDGKVKLKDISSYRESNFKIRASLFSLFAMIIIVSIIFSVGKYLLPADFSDDNNSTNHISTLMTAMLATSSSSIFSSLISTNFITLNFLRIPKISFRIFDSRIN